MMNFLIWPIFFLICFSCSTLGETDHRATQKKYSNPSKNGDLNSTDFSKILLEIGNKNSPEHGQKIPQNEISSNANDSVRAFSEVIEMRMSTMLNAQFSPAERSLLKAHGELLRIFELLRLKDYASVQQSAELFMAQSGLSSQMYRWSLSAYAIADSQLIQLKIKNSKNNEQFIPQFQEFQNYQCKALCDTEGWAVISRDDAASLSITGYSNKILSAQQFQFADLERPLWLAHTLGEKQALKKSVNKDTPRFESNIVHMRALMAMNKVTEAARVAFKIPQPPEPNHCPSEFIYAQFVLGQASRGAQDRNKFFEYQKTLLDRLENSACTEKNFGMEFKQFQTFYLDAKIWLARLQWEQNLIENSIQTSSQAMVYAQKNKQWELFAEASQVLVGRAGFEAFTPQQNALKTEELEKYFQKFDSDEFELWVKSRQALFFFLDGKFLQSAKKFKEIAEKHNDNNVKSFAEYWHGRSLRAQKRDQDAEISFENSGKFDPLSIYDVFSGQILNRKSGRTSTNFPSPFQMPWQIEVDRWLALKNERAFLLFQPNTWFEKNNFETNKSEPINPGQEMNSFDISLRSALLLTTFIRASGSFQNFEEYSQYLRDSGTLSSRILKSEVSWLRQSASDKFNRDKKPPVGSSKIAWLLHVTGDYVNAILFVGRLRNTSEFNNESNSFLYFIFYPRPFSNQYSQAAKKCDVDPDLLYAISRQESMFVPEVRSNAGAIGLMQLLPSTAKKALTSFPEFQNAPIDLTNVSTNVVAGACYVKSLLKRYNGNLTFTVAAYNAGEGAVDRWINKRNRLKDMPFFIEFIPYLETKNYVQRVLRNYYNIKWIYSAAPQLPVNSETEITVP